MDAGLGHLRPVRLALLCLWLCGGLAGLAGCASTQAPVGDGSTRVVTRTSAATVWATPEAAQAAATAAAAPARPALAARPVAAAPAGAAAAAGRPAAQKAQPDAGPGGARSSLATQPSPALAAGWPQTLYFDFDQFDIKDEFKPLLEGHAQALRADRSQQLVIEGHADERGSTEYNLALGQKRAHAVARALLLLGAADAQVEAVSFGDTRPAVARSNEEAWARNRRAEIKRR